MSSGGILIFFASVCNCSFWSAMIIPFRSRCSFGGARVDSGRCKTFPSGKCRIPPGCFLDGGYSDSGSVMHLKPSRFYKSILRAFGKEHGCKQPFLWVRRRWAPALHVCSRVGTWHLGESPPSGKTRIFKRGRWLLLSARSV